MNIQFIYMGAENLGIEYLSAAAKLSGHSTTLAFDPAIFDSHLMWDIKPLARLLDLRNRIVRDIADDPPDIVAYSCITENFLWSLDLAARIKAAAPSVKNVFGGIHPTAVPHRVIAHPQVDAVFTGESDISLPMMLDLWAENPTAPPIPGVWVKYDGQTIKNEGILPPLDLDKLPFPDKQLFYSRVPALRRHYMIMTARGCPFNCSYCYKSLSSSRLPGHNPIRRRSVDNVIAELAPHTSTGRVSMVVFRDDVFTLKKSWLREFATKYSRDIHLPYFCYTHPGALDEESASLLKDSGCSFVTMGVQSADERQRRTVLNRKYTNDQVRHSVSLLQKHRIQLSLDHITGFPGDDIPMLERAALFYNELRPTRLLSFWLTYYPGTQITQTALAAGAITAADVENFENGAVGYYYSGSGASRQDASFQKLITVMSLVGLLPRKLLKAIVEKRIYNIFPASFWINNMIIAFNAIRTRDPFFFNNLRIFLSRKNVP